MFSIPGIDRSMRKNDIRDYLLERAAVSDYPLSKSRANNLADKYKKGEYDFELDYILNYHDPVGEKAVNNVMKSERYHAAGAAHNGSNLLAAK